MDKMITVTQVEKLEDMPCSKMSFLASSLMSVEGDGGFSTIICIAKHGAMRYVTITESRQQVLDMLGIV